MAMSPRNVSIRTYHVGFGDCFLLSFDYGPKVTKHVLIDFGSTGIPKGIRLKKRMMNIALDIKQRTNGRLHAVVVTHRHKDHLSGFETKGGKGSGDVIRSLKPELVVQPWTEDPKVGTSATAPGRKQPRGGMGKHIAALAAMQDVAQQTLSEARRTRFLSGLRPQLSFLGESNIKNPSAVKNLMTMGKKNSYVYCGARSGLENVLPGVKVDVLGPPTVQQSSKVKKQRASDPQEFWQLQANSMRLATGGDGSTPVLFPRFVRSRGSNFPVNTRWLIFHARSSRGAQLLEIVRMLDKVMNNTSVILLLRIGQKRLLFPGDAQIENWEYALGQAKYRDILPRVNLYKVGHHGSRNATPRTLWGMFKNKSKLKTKAGRLQSLMSTMEGKHGSARSHTEVPRETLVRELKEESDLFTTQELTGKDFFHDTLVTFSGGRNGSPAGATKRPRRPTQRLRRGAPSEGRRT